MPHETSVLQGELYPWQPFPIHYAITSFPDVQSVYFKLFSFKLLLPCFFALQIYNTEVLQTLQYHLTLKC